MDKPRKKTREIFEGVTFRTVVNLEEDTTIIEAFFCKNPVGGDPAFTNLWAVPRLIYYHGERADEVSQRLCAEFGAKINSIEYVSIALDEKSHTETLFSQIHIVHLANNPLVDAQHRWFRLDDLPPTVTDLHRTSIIPRALTVYKQTIFGHSHF